MSYQILEANIKRNIVINEENLYFELGTGRNLNAHCVLPALFSDVHSERPEVYNTRSIHLMLGCDVIRKKSLFRTNLAYDKMMFSPVQAIFLCVLRHLLLKICVSILRNFQSDFFNGSSYIGLIRVQRKMIFQLVSQASWSPDSTIQRLFSGAFLYMQTNRSKKGTCP